VFITNFGADPDNNSLVGTSRTGEELAPVTVACLLWLIFDIFDQYPPVATNIARNNIRVERPDRNLSL
jgi:hypothetical protein